MAESIRLEKWSEQGRITGVTSGTTLCLIEYTGDTSNGIASNKIMSVDDFFGSQDLEIPYGDIENGNETDVASTLEVYNWATSKFPVLVNNIIQTKNLPSYIDDVIDVKFWQNGNPTEQTTDDLWYVPSGMTMSVYSGSTWVEIAKETGKIYINISQDQPISYRWSGSVMVDLTGPLEYAKQEEVELTNPIEDTKVMTALKSFQGFKYWIENFTGTTLETPNKSLVGGINDVNDLVRNMDISVDYVINGIGIATGGTATIGEYGNFLIQFYTGIPETQGKLIFVQTNTNNRLFEGVYRVESVSPLFVLAEKILNSTDLTIVRTKDGKALQSRYDGYDLDTLEFVEIGSSSPSYDFEIISSGTAFNLKNATEHYVSTQLVSGTTYTITLPTPIPTKVNESIIIFKTPSSGASPIITYPANILWRGVTPTVVSDGKYWTIVFEQVWTGVGSTYLTFGVAIKTV